MFERRSCGNGTKGPRYGDWALIATADPREFLLIRRFPDRDKNQYAFYLCWAPEGRPATMTYFITIAGRRWPVEITFKTGKDALGWDQSQARTWDAICRHTALTALAQLRTAAIQAALAGADVLPAAAPAARTPRPPSASPPPAPLTCSSTPEPRRCPPAAASPARPASPRSGCPPPRPPASSASPATGKPASSASPASPSVSAGQHGAAPPGPRPLAPLQHPPGSPRHLTRDGRKEVTPRNRHALTTSHAELQRGHRPKNSNCNTSRSRSMLSNPRMSFRVASGNDPHSSPSQHSSAPPSAEDARARSACDAPPPAGSHARSFSAHSTSRSRPPLPITGVLTPACPTLHALWQTN